MSELRHTGLTCEDRQFISKTLIQHLIIYYVFFKQVIEEARRVIQVDAGKPQDFMRNCVDKLTQEIEFMIYYGIDTKGISPPRSPHISKYSINKI